MTVTKSTRVPSSTVLRGREAPSIRLLYISRVRGKNINPGEGARGVYLALGRGRGAGGQLMSTTNK